MATNKGVQGNNEIISITAVGSGISIPIVKFFVGILAKDCFKEGLKKHNEVAL